MPENIFYDISNERLQQQENIFGAQPPEIQPEELRTSVMKAVLTIYLDDWFTKETEWIFPNGEEVGIPIEEARENFIRDNFSGTEGGIEGLMEVIDDYERERNGETVYHLHATSEWSEFVKYVVAVIAGKTPEKPEVTTYDPPEPSEMDDLFPLLAETYQYYSESSAQFMSHVGVNNGRMPINFEQNLSIWMNDPSEDKAIWHAVIGNPVKKYFKSLIDKLDASPVNDSVRTDHIIKIVADAIMLGIPKIAQVVLAGRVDLNTTELAPVLARLEREILLQEEQLKLLEDEHPTLQVNVLNGLLKSPEAI